MAKQGMKRPEMEHRKNTISPVPIIHGKAKSGKIKMNPLIPEEFPAIDNDLVVENFTNDFDMTAADMQDLR